MTISHDLFLSILALNSYNRGYNVGVKELSDDIGTKIGDASIIARKGDQAAKDAGFYATAYTWAGETIFSYRGTDNYGLSNDPVSGASDIWSGWSISQGYTEGTQAGNAIEFYESVINRFGASSTVYDHLPAHCPAVG